MEVKNEVGIPSYNCEICEKNCTTKEGFTRHIKSHNETEVRCDFCNKTFISTGRLNYHTRDVHSNKKYQCTKCDQQFQSQHNLNLHEKRVHLKERDFKCTICGTSFFRKTALSIHTQRLHSSIDKKEICNFCGESFVD